jgi:hemin uptake protein HemP
MRFQDRRPAADKTKRAINSEELFGDQKEIIILHAGEEYRLRITNNGKLILTK